MWPILILAGAAFLFSKQVSTAINQVEVLPRGIKFQRSGLTINLLYTFDIYNPADVAATIDAVSGRILAGTTQLGTFLTREPVIIQARTTTTSTATVRIDSITALMQLYKVWQSGKTPTITIAGLLQTKLASIPYTYTVLVGQDLKLKKQDGVAGIGSNQKIVFTVKYKDARIYTGHSATTAVSEAKHYSKHHSPVTVAADDHLVATYIDGKKQ